MTFLEEKRPPGGFFGLEGVLLGEVRKRVVFERVLRERVAGEEVFGFWGVWVEICGEFGGGFLGGLGLGDEVVEDFFGRVFEILKEMFLVNIWFTSTSTYGKIKFFVNGNLN